MDLQVVSNMSDELNNELILSDEQLEMTVVVPNGESESEHNYLPTMSDELMAVSTRQHVRMTTTTFQIPNGESHEHNFPNGDESHHHGHNFPNGHESHEHNNPSNTMSDHDNSFNDFDVGSLLAIVDDILTHSTHIIHTLVQVRYSHHT